MKFACLHAFAFAILFSNVVWGDAGVFTGTGQNLTQISTKLVQLVSINVKIVLGRGHFLCDGSVEGMDEAEYDCRFILRNLTDKACDIQVGFPIDSEFAKMPDRMLPFDAKEIASRDWVGDYSFNARDESSTYHVTFQCFDPKQAPKAYSALFTWMMTFQPHETRTLIVQYRMPISLTLAPTTKRGVNQDEILRKFMDGPWCGWLDVASAEIAGYTTETGSTWSGNVESATFTVITAPFEKYLDYRGLTEKKLTDEPADVQKRVERFYPVQHPWLFRDIEPAGWKPVEDGIQWEYKNYKPKDPITICYYQMQFPQLASEVDPWVDALVRSSRECKLRNRRIAIRKQISDPAQRAQEMAKIKEINDPVQEARDLTVAKQILMATYGQEPTDETAREFVLSRFWYAPRKDFSISSLSKDQQAVLAALDQHVKALSKQQ